jgi:hypothetical protein
VSSPDSPEQITITVTINGTAQNPWHRYNLRQNPFPQLAKAEYDAACRAIASLDGDPITDAQQIRDRLPGFGAPFVELCVSQYRPGQRVCFRVTFPAERGAQ